MFGSTSPSHLLLASLDATRKYMVFEGKKVLKENLKLAEDYWKSGTDEKHQPKICEMLVDGDIVVVEIVKEINANIKLLR